VPCTMLIQSERLRRVIRLAAANPCTKCEDTARLLYGEFLAWQRAVYKQEAPGSGIPSASTDLHSSVGSFGGCYGHSAR
jgi:hypothetical protein